MESPKLKINKHEIGLRKIGDNLFEPKSINILTHILEHDEVIKDSRNISRDYILNPTPKHTDKPVHQIQSFCTVITDHIKREGAITIFSLRQFHTQPIYVLCDEQSKEYLSLFDFTGIIYTVFDPDNIIIPKILKHNDFHKPDIISQKMVSMNIALGNHDNTMFLDSDIIVLNSLQENFTENLCLSPHFWEGDLKHAGYEIGFYNAGYIFCADKKIPNIWRHMYFHDSCYYEQECMNRLSQWTQIETFDTSHNIGFWRKDNRGETPLDVKSFHVHLSDDMYTGTEFQTHTDLNKKFRQKVFHYLRRNHSELLYFIQQALNDWETMVLKVNAHSNSKSKIKIDNEIVFSHHRSGWGYVTRSLKSINNSGGILFDTFVENKFLWNSKPTPYDEPWIGCIHNPPSAPKWKSNTDVCQHPQFIESLKTCKGLFCLSEHLKRHVSNQVDVPVNVLFHPTQFSDTKFNYDKFKSNINKSIYAIGHWLRRAYSIYKLPIVDTYTKISVQPYHTDKPNKCIADEYDTQLDIEDIKIENKYEENTHIIPRMSNKEYDEALSCNIVYLDLYDSSANNAIVECIARGTPILVNPIPPVVEYLGKDYPFYFNSPEEAAEKALNLDLVKSTHKYLMTCKTRDKLTMDYFIQSIMDSDIYKQL